MARWWDRLVLLALAGAFCVLATGCFGRWRLPPSPVKAGFDPVQVLDPIGEAQGTQTWDMRDLFALAERVRTEKKPAVLPPKRNILVLSGGGSYGAYSAGVLVGWSHTGTRPAFDVVTGISTGALIAPLAFLGEPYDCEIENLYTTLRTQDIFRLKKTVRSIFSEGLADSSPLGKKIEQLATPELLREIAAEHAKGRRLYIGTTELESRRAVVWDMGEIATRGTPDDAALFRKVLLASASIPGVFPPVTIPVTIDGKPYTERHVDGGVTQALFLRPPVIKPEDQAEPGRASLYGSDLHIIVAGKLFADASLTPLRVLNITAGSVSTLIYAQTRGDLLKLYTGAILTGMNYKLAAIDPDFVTTASAYEFEPKEMTKLFREGYRQATSERPWRTTPPGIEKSEGAFLRVGPTLRRFDSNKPYPPAPVSRFRDMMNRLTQSGGA